MSMKLRSTSIWLASRRGLTALEADALIYPGIWGPLEREGALSDDFDMARVCLAQWTTRSQLNPV